MVKKGSTKSKKPAKKPVEPKVVQLQDPPTEPAAKPGVMAYALAVVYLLRDSAKRHKLLFIGVAMFFLAIFGLRLSAWLADRAVLTNDELVIRVSKELKISGDANPAILTVEDQSKVSQPFLEGSKNGDKILLYYKAGKSVIFRPSEDKIIREGTYTPPDAKIFIRKGTADDSKVATARQKIEPMENSDISSQDNSTNMNYANTVVVNVTDRYNEQAQEVADTIGATVQRLPKGETIPDADILVIVGNN